MAATWSMIENRRWPSISRAFVASVLLAASIVVDDPKDLGKWKTAIAVVAAAVSGGARKNGKNGNQGDGDRR